jgi:anion-transporting  ArsA/GET3 family ATPase
MTVGKVFYEVTREEGGRPLWDVVVVDAPATGHGLQYLRMPQAARDTFGAGLVQREAARIVSLLQDPKTTAIHVVTLAEDMPVTETLEAREQLLGALGLPLGAVIVNRVHDRQFDQSVLGALARASDTADAPKAAILRGVADRASEESGWTAINVQHLERLRRALTGEPIVLLPYLFAEEFGRAEIDRLSQLFETARAARPGLRA